MCAIVDKNVVGLVFSDHRGRSEAARKFLEYIDSGKLRLVVGGRLAEELARSSMFRSWLAEAVQSGTASFIPTQKVDEVEQRLIQEGKFKSDDPHVLALARVAGARLLYTHDDALTEDFKNPALIPEPRGKVYRTSSTARVGKHHRRMLDNANCRT